MDEPFRAVVASKFSLRMSCNVILKILDMIMIKNNVSIKSITNITFKDFVVPYAAPQIC